MALSDGISKGDLVFRLFQRVRFGIGRRCASPVEVEPELKQAKADGRNADHEHHELRAGRVGGCDPDHDREDGQHQDGHGGGDRRHGDATCRSGPPRGRTFW
jgi:hypothetical protein